MIITPAVKDLMCDFNIIPGKFLKQNAKVMFLHLITMLTLPKMNTGIPET
jgi:hypothetical protein